VKSKCASSHNDYTVRCFKLSRRVNSLLPEPAGDEFKGSALYGHDRSKSDMRTILILVASAFCFFSAKADDDYATIVRYLGENGHYIISPDDVAKVQAFMKAHGYQHVSEIPKGPFAAAASVAQPTAAEGKPSSGPWITPIVVPSATPAPASTKGGGYVFLSVIIAIYCIPLFITFLTIPLAILNVALGWTLIGWIGCLAWTFAQGKK
jgi:hypothetical protein